MVGLMQQTEAEVEYLVHNSEALGSDFEQDKQVLSNYFNLSTSLEDGESVTNRTCVCTLSKLARRATTSQSLVAESFRDRFWDPGSGLIRSEASRQPRSGALSYEPYQP
eukprot:7472601-Pyramimonas_sp.AAC.3